MREKPFPKLQRAICCAAVTALAGLFILWVGKSGGMSLYELLAALGSLALFILLGLRFVERAFAFLFDEERAERESAAELPPLLIFCVGLAVALLNYALVWAVLRYVNHDLSLESFLGFWRSADAYHYLCIARDWYLSEGELDRLVQLVFLPGFPLVLRLFHFLTGEYLCAGMLCSALCFSGALCVLYRLALLDFDERGARRVLRFTALTPGAFFFFAPMSEGLFLLLSVLCVYCARRKRWWLAGLFGGYAAFTRSLGLMLFVPLLLEWGRGVLRGEEKLRRGLALLLLPLGFAAYLAINAAVAGNPFQFMIYQREHWYQGLGLFFNTAAYQTRYALSAAAAGNVRQLWGLWIPNLCAVFGALAILLAGVRRIRASYSAWAIAYYGIAIGATWLLSAPRYMAALPPLALSLAAVSERKWLRTLLSVLLGIAGTLYLLFFALRWNVW